MDLRADQRTADDVAEGGTEPEPAEYRHEDQRGGEHDRAAFEDCGSGLRSLGGSGHRAAPDRREQRSEGKQDRPMP